MTRQDLYRMAKVVRENPRVRKVALPTYRRLVRMMVLGRGPRVLINSVPKAGTHVLSTLVRQFSGMTHSGLHYVFDDFRLADPRPPIWGDIPDVNWPRLRETFASVPRSQFLTGHLPALPQFLQILNDLEYKTLFIIRDPRDVVVSSALYMAKLKRHVMHDRYAQDFKTDHDRILATITGFPPSKNGRGSESVGQRIAKYLPWLTTPTVHSCRFEAMIGPMGGGSSESQTDTVAGIAHYLGFQMRRDSIAMLAGKTWSEGSPTFRKGSIGDWKNHFTDEHKAAFKEVAGEYLITLGYEDDFNW